jgi:hypothetical protein
VSFNLLALDRRVARLVADHRRAAAALAAGQPALLPDDRWLGDEGFAELAAVDDDLARAILAWVEALRDERRGWPARAEAEALLHAPREVPHLEGATTLAALRRAMLAERSDDRAALHAEAWSREAGQLSDLRVAAWVERLARGGTPLAVHGLEEGRAPRLAEAFLDRTDDLAEAIGSPLPAAAPPLGILRATIGRDAGDGWPARLNAAWLEDRFRPAGWLEGRRPRRLALMPPLGAASFARVLGNLGAALFEAGRAPALPFASHEHPRGLRRHRRRALFASLAASEAFGRRALGLGRDRAREQARRVARAFLLSLRIDAARPLWLEAIASGEGVARELFAALGERVFLRAPPSSWLATLPSLRTGDAPWIIGCFVGGHDARVLVERFDEDWFDNPRAAEALRAEDAGPDGGPSDEVALEIAIERLAGDLERAAG